jgi:hypothetical protein
MRALQGLPELDTVLCSEMAPRQIFRTRNGMKRACLCVYNGAMDGRSIGVSAQLASNATAPSVASAPPGLGTAMFGRVS